MPSKQQKKVLRRPGYAHVVGVEGVRIVELLFQRFWVQNTATLPQIGDGSFGEPSVLQAQLETCAWHHVQGNVPLDVAGMTLFEQFTLLHRVAGVQGKLLHPR